MSDERRQTPTVNLQELERQLREAARARQRAQASADTLSGGNADRTAPQPIPNPPVQSPMPQAPVNPPAASQNQPGLPFTAAQPAAGFRPLTPNPASAPAQVPPQPPVMPQAGSYFAQAPIAREPQPRDIAPSYQAPVAEPRERSFAPQPQTEFRPERPDDLERDFGVLKSDQMGDVYPAYDPATSEAVGQDEFYSAAAYEEPAANAYDRYTEDQFPRIEAERRTGGITKFVIWIVIIAIIGGGGYFAFPLVQSLFTSGSQTAKAPPLIKADPNPVKVEPETQPQDNANAQKDIFTKHANEDPKAAQMAQQPEQPVDVNAAAKSAAQSTNTSKPAIVPLVPGTGEPRIVKTVTVRADGTIIPEKSDPDLAAKTLPPTGPKVISMPQPVAPLASEAPAPSSAEPNLPAKPVAVSPEFALEGPIPLPPQRDNLAEQDFSLPLDAVTTPLPAATPEPAAAPAAPAPATPAPATPAPAPAAAVVPAGKDFGVQFGAPETEAKGNELKARIEKQFASALSGATMAVVKGESNGKTVYRVRAIGYTRDEASAVCQQVTAAGGQCFVSRNN